MTCKYNFKGIEFQSEEELNDFLLDRGITENLPEDVVFQIMRFDTPYQDHCSKIFEKQQTLYEELKNKGIQLNSIQDSEEVEPEELDDVGTLRYPYISVTDLIHTMPGRYTEQVFPIFRSDEYWSKKFVQYRAGIFDEYEVQFIKDLLKSDALGNYEAIHDENILNKIRDRIEGELENGIRKGGLWKQQAICGNLVHEMFSRFYRDTVPYTGNDGKTYKGKHLYKLKNSPQEIVNYFNKNLGRYKKYISDSVIESVVKQCIQFDNELRQKYGENAYIRTEQPIVGNVRMVDKTNQKISKVIGKIDLIVIGDKKHKGQVGIIDFKCSPKNYTTSNMDNDPNYYNSAKILTFKYQLAVYREILKQQGINPSNAELFVVPLKFENFKMENGLVSFTGISSLGDLSEGTMLQKLSSSDIGNERNNIEGNLDQIFPKDSYIKTSLGTEKVISTTKKIMDKWCPVKQKNTTVEGYKEYIESHDGIRYDNSTNKFYFKPNKMSDDGMITKEASSQEEATIKIIEELQKIDEYNESFAVNTSNTMRKMFNAYYQGEEENPIEQIQRGYSSQRTSSKRNVYYIKSQLEKYTDTSIWKPIPSETSDPINDILDQFGLLLFENKASKMIEVVRISALYDPRRKVSLPKGKYMLGAFVSDQVSHPSADSWTMLSTKGNIELIETMVVLNQLNDLFKGEFTGVGKIKLICPRQQTGLDVPNEQLLYNFDRLCKQDTSIIKNNFITDSNSTSDIKMARYIDILEQDFKEITNKEIKYGLNSLDRDLKNSVSKFDWKGKTQEAIKDALIQLDKELVNKYPEVTQNIKERIDDNNPQYRLHKDILYVIAELSGVKMLQQLEEQKKFEFNIAGDNIGLGGTMVDNPGTLQSAILNQATNQVTIAYQNTRDSVQKFDQILREKVIKLKEKKGFTWISQNFTGNQTRDLYKNMYDQTSSDIKFKNPWENNDLTDEEREFLKYAIIKINSTRGNGLNLEKLLANPNLMAEMIARDSEGKYLMVPLIKGDFASEVAMRDGLINFIRDRFKYLTLWKKDTRIKLKKKIDDEVTNLLDTTQKGGKYDLIRRGEQWEAVNTMSDLDDPKNAKRRQDKINERGKAYFEHNLETLLLKQHSAYVMAEELNKVFPVIQSLLIHLNSQGAILNTSFTNDIQYLLDYIKTKVHNQPMEDRNTQEAKLRDIVNEMMKWASRLALSFNPRQTYQFLDGIWQDIKLFVKQPDGTLAFTKENLTTAWKFVMADLFGSYGDDRSITELLNIKYGINDMDMNSYINKIKSDSTGLFTHFWDTGFRFSSRPDYYNRMTIFISQMLADGSIKIKNGKVSEDSAHKLKNGKLVYDWTKDDRFRAFAEEDKSDIKKYNEAKSNYITLARQLIEEETLNDDGTKFKLDLKKKYALPKAYSNKESEGRKAFSDRIYGYYAHEKKSMFNSTFVGSLFMQMNTYWSAKKNQYIQQRSYTQEGYYTDYVEDGVSYFWKCDENGNLDITTENTGVPVQIWKGRPQEGIVITLVNMKRAFNGDYEGLENVGLKGVKELFNNENIDPDLRRLYAANFRQLWYDLLMLLLLGVFASSLMHSGQKEFAKDHPNENFGNALANTAINLGIGIIDSSADDFNFAKSIFGRGTQWTPFAISSMKNVVNQYASVIKGNQDFYDAVIKTSAATRGTTPFWEFVKLNTIGEN